MYQDEKIAEKEKFEKNIDGNDKRVQIYVKESDLEYHNELNVLQIELLKLQNFVKKNGLKMALVFEGRDAAGKGGTIKRITEHLNPRGARIVALEKPCDIEKTQWYFQRYVQHLPSAGEIVIFDRSWYNRAGVEPVMGFCTAEEHREFLKDVPNFEKMIVKSEIILIKFYFSVSKEIQAKRFKERKLDPLKQYKLSQIDKKSQQLWDKYTEAKFSMLMASNTIDTPWTIIRSDNKKKARLNCIKHILNKIEYDKKISIDKLKIDENILISGTQELILMNNSNKLERLG